MSNIGKPERATQNRIIALFQSKELGYEYLGDWHERESNSNIEEELLTKYLRKNGYSDSQINKAIHTLRAEADNSNRGLYGNNKKVYSLLRYGCDVKVDVSKNTEKVKYVNWEEPENNDFYIAEEVTLRGNHERRPDVVLYVNGIAVAVIELKSSSVSIGDGIRQLLSNQDKQFNQWFFSTVQLVFAGNDSEGLKYGTVGTPEKYFLKWKEDEESNEKYKLDKYLLKMCSKQRLIELMYDFVLFDAGVKKVPRVHQYFGIKHAQEFVKRREGGIIWHTQGSGKSIVMVLLAKWILENNPNGRVVIITDRDSLDVQIKDVFQDAGEPIERASSGRDLMTKLGKSTPRLLCSLVHKFGRKKKDDEESFEKFIREIESGPNQTVGELFVLVDECHRTQSGKLHRVMKAIMPNAVFIGFTGTPLLKQDKAKSLEVFGKYIHTYKFSEAVDDDVVLDLIYEARDVDQELGSQDKIDSWFEAKTRGLNDWQKAALREKWATMQKVLSSRSRMERIVSDIVFDFSVKPRLSNARGTAMLVTYSIYEACKYYELFQKTAFRGKCSIITSYNPLTRDVTKENTGANTETEKEYIYSLYTDLLKEVEAKPGKSKTEVYEEQAIKLFKTEPANMKLLIVVDKLLTGFDAPSCTYLYIDKKMVDHGLFQAICRTNRLDGEDKEFGYIVDYMNLFDDVKQAISVYSSELHHEDGEKVDPAVMMKERLAKGRERLDDALETLGALCEKVAPPGGELEHIRYFCGNTEMPKDLEEREPQRVALYKGTASAVRAFASIADELEAAGYDESEAKQIRLEIDRYVKLREIVRNASGESLDLKAYESDMRHLIDTYINAEEPRKISDFDNLTLVELIVKSGIAEAVTSLPKGIREKKEAVAETIENNVRSTIIRKHLNDPAYYDRMSEQLQELIEARRARAIEYEEYLNRIAELVKRVELGAGDETPKELDTPGKRAIFNNLPSKDEFSEEEAKQLALKIDNTVRDVRPDGWREVKDGPKERVIKAALLKILGEQSKVEEMILVIRENREY